MITRTAIHPFKILAAAGVAFVLWGLVLTSPAHAATFTVNSPADTDDGACTTASGGCTLREAINAANSSSGVADTINFDLGPSATITLNSVAAGGLGSLPTITDSAELTIDGESADITVSGNDAVAVFSEQSGAKLTLSNLTVTKGNGAFSSGGGITNGGTLTVNNSTFSGNSAANSGGGILNTGGVTVNNSTFSNNSSGFGGGIAGNGGVTVNNSTFSGNSASQGGVIYNLGAVTVNNSTLSGNSASFGGGIFNDRGTLTVNNSTLSGNSGSIVGGGIFNAGGATLKNTIVANSPSGGNCNTPPVGSQITDDGGNLDDGATCGLTDPSSKSNTPAGLDPAGLKDNGGPTDTIALCSGVDTPADCDGPSAAIDAAVDCPPPATDQRGVERPQGPACDIGAYEVQNLTTEPPPDKRSCRKGGFREFGFKNQGACIKAVNHAN